MQWDPSVEGERPSASQETQKFCGQGLFVTMFAKSAACPYPESEEPDRSP